MNQSAFLARVREAARAGRAFRVTHSDELAAPLPLARVDDRDLPARLAAEIEAVGGHAHRASDWVDATVQLAQLLDRYQPRAALCWQGGALGAVRLNDLLSERNMRRIDYESLHQLDPAEQRRQILAADIGITGVAAAVAETGSLVMVGGPGCERVASLAPPVHVAVVAANQILADLFDVFPGVDRGGHRAADASRAAEQPSAALAAQFDPAQMPSNVAFITGPSKTGDLELKLTTGVHGPGQWHVILVRTPLP